MTATPLSVNRPVITHTAALRAIGAALAHAESLQISVAAAVVNSGERSPALPACRTHF